ncbi:helix-turn-helix transcriptional regulator [Gemella sp. 20925_1_85]|uniref:helix-turn-helix domain-containing protein n=1 Tax=Gemella sp. 20925_1_85 TaxID=3003690 RepID=UPI00352E1E81
MDDNKIHGKIFKQIREGRGVKLKDAAGDAISVRTLIRFEADETSVSLEIFEQLLRNIGVGHHDYFSEYLPLIDADQTGFLKEARQLDISGNYSAIKTLAIKTLEKEIVPINTRLFIEQYLSVLSETAGPQIVRENRVVVLEHLKKLDVHNVNELFALAFILRTTTEEELSNDFVRRIINENLKPRNSDNVFSSERGERSLFILNNAIALLSRRGFVEEAEEYCIKAIDLIKTHYINLTHFIFHLTSFNYILAQMQLKLNKPEGVKLANKCIRLLDAQIDINDLLVDKLTRERLVKWFYERNKTGIDFEF